MPIVVLEPSCASVFRDELTNLLPDDPRAHKLKANTHSAQRVPRAAGAALPAARARPARFVVQGHCHHHRADEDDRRDATARATGAEVRLLDSGCCGMAGPFGFERDKFDVSQTLAERGLLPAVRAAGADTILVADGFSCREQIAQNSTRRGLHLAEVLAPDAEL